MFARRLDGREIKQMCEVSLLAKATQLIELDRDDGGGGDSISVGLGLFIRSFVYLRCEASHARTSVKWGDPCGCVQRVSETLPDQDPMELVGNYTNHVLWVPPSLSSRIEEQERGP